MNERLLTSKEVAAMLGTTVGTLAHWRYVGRGPTYVKLSHTNVRYPLSEVQRYIESNTVRPGA